LTATNTFWIIVFVTDCATGWTIRVIGFDSRRRLGIFLFTSASGTVLGPTQPPIQLVPGSLSLGVKRSGREASHSSSSSAEVKECVELYLHSPNTPSWRGAQLKSTGTTLPLALPFTACHQYQSATKGDLSKILLRFK
jgi:hypothetical protein